MVIDPLFITTGVKVANRGLIRYKGQELPVELDPSFNKIFDSIWIPQGHKLESTWKQIKKTSSKSRKGKSVKKDLAKLRHFLDWVVKLLEYNRDEDISQIEF